MSNALAIATVTACLRNLLEDAILHDPDDAMSGAEVKMVVPGSQAMPTKGAVLFLARITPSAAWRGVDLPTRDSDGSLIERPQVGLCLHYLLALRGDEQSYEPHRIAGIIARVLAVKPVLSRDLISTTIASQHSILGNSNLMDAANLVRITPESLTTDELSKIWTAYPQASQGPWLAYEATTVVLDTQDAVGPALPVRTRNVYVNAISSIRITGVSSSADPEDPIVAESEIVIAGYNLSLGEAVLVFFDGEKDGATPDEATPTAVTIHLPNTLLAGTHGVRVARMATIGTELRRIADSNFFPFTLSPVIETIGPLTAGQLTITFDPLLGNDQTFELLLNGIDGVTGCYSFTAARRTDPNPVGSITIPVHDVPTGTYLARIRVDGASSALEGGGTTDYSGPKVDIP